LPTGDFVASLFAECANDSIALIASNPEVENVDDPILDEPTDVTVDDVEEVPEPSAVLSMVLVGGGFIARRSRRRAASS